jgi:hypothetical protein
MIVVLAAFLALAAAQPCAATLWLVGSTNDTGFGTLRDALAKAADGDVIDFEVSGTIALTNGQLMVTNSVTIKAETEVVTVDGRQASRVFYIGPGKTVKISCLTIANGHTSAEGGGVFSAGALTLTNCTLRNNWATLGGGGVYAEGTPDTPVTLRINGCTLSNNVAGIADVCHGGGAVALVAVAHDSQGSRADALTIENSLLTGNDAPYGGGIVIDVDGGTGAGNDALASVTVIDSTLRDNVATAPENASYGGAIALTVDGDSTPASMASVSVENCTLSGNVATNGSGFAMGGAVFGSIGGSGSGMVCLKNSTLSGNAAGNAGGSGIGGAAALMKFGGVQAQVILSNCTLIANHDNAGASGILNDGGTVGIENSIFANDPSGTNLVNGWMIGGGTIASYGCNLSTDSAGGFLTATGDLVNVDPMLGSLQDNGGPTWTCAPRFGSPAIDAGLVTGGLPAIDQRGYPRTVNGRVDIGAYESGFAGCLITNLHASGSANVLAWTAFPKWLSSVMYSTNLVSMPFAALTSGNAYPFNQYTDAVHAAGDTRFYRVKIAPQP